MDLFLDWEMHHAWITEESCLKRSTHRVMKPFLIWVLASSCISRKIQIASLRVPLQCHCPAASCLTSVSRWSKFWFLSLFASAPLLVEAWSLFDCRSRRAWCLGPCRPASQISPELSQASRIFQCETAVRPLPQCRLPQQEPMPSSQPSMSSGHRLESERRRFRELCTSLCQAEWAVKSTEREVGFGRGAEGLGRAPQQVWVSLPAQCPKMGLWRACSSWLAFGSNQCKNLALSKWLIWDSPFNFTRG